MLRSIIEGRCPSNYLVCLSTMGLSDFLRKLLGCVPYYPSDKELARNVIDMVVENDVVQKNITNCFSKELLALCKLYLDKLKPRVRSTCWRNNLSSSDLIILFFQNMREIKDPEDYERLSQSLNLLVLKSSKKVSRKDLHLFADEYNRVEVGRAIKFLLGIKKKLDRVDDEPAQELKSLFKAAVQNLDSYLLRRNFCDKSELSDARASLHASKILAHLYLSWTGEDTIAALSRVLKFPFPLNSILAVVETDPSLNVKVIKKTLHEQTNESEKIDHAKKVLQKIGRNVESQPRAGSQLTKKYLLGCFSKKCPVTDLYLRAVEDLNLYCLANGIDLDVNKSFNIEAPSLVDVTKFLDYHQVGVQNKHLIRAFLSTVGYPNSDSRAIAAAMRQTYNNFAEVSAGRQDLGDLHEVRLMNLISASVIRNKVFEDINPAFVANTQRINEFLDTSGLEIPYMNELTLLNYLAFVGRYEDDCIVKASRLPIPKWSSRHAPIKCRFLDRNKLYYKGVFNLFVAWQEINNRLSWERPKEPIFCSEFISKLVEQSAGKYSEALVEGIQNFCAVHEFDAYPDFLQPFFKENNHLCEFLDSNWDKILSNINIFRSLSVLATAGMSGTNVNDIVNIINSDKLRGFGKCHSNFEAVNLSKELLIVAAATNQIHKLTVLKDPKGQDYVPTFESLLREIIYSEKSTDLALSKSERISKSMRELKTYLLARSLKLPAFEEFESFIKSKFVSKIAGQPDPLGFLDLYGQSKIERNRDEIKRLACLPTIPVDYSAPCGRFDYLLATHKLVYSMKKAKLPSSMFKVENFPDLRYRYQEQITVYDELIGEYEVYKAEKLLAGFYGFVTQKVESLPQHFVEAADAVNLLCLSMGGLSINESKWRDHEISDDLVKEFKREANIPEEIAKDDKLMKDFLLFHGLIDNKDSIIRAMQLRQECSDYRARLQATRKVNTDPDIPTDSNDDSSELKQVTVNDSDNHYSELKQVTVNDSDNHDSEFDEWTIEL